MQVADKIVTILLVEAHKGTSHDDKLYLISIVPEPLKLLNSVLGLQVGVVARADSSHRCGLVPCITLC